MSRIATALCTLVIALGFAGGVSAQQKPPVVVGVLAFGGEADAHRRWGSTLDVLSAAMPDKQFELVPLSLDGANAALDARGLHFLITNPGHFQSLILKHELAPLVSLQTDAPGQVHTGSRYGAVIFARASEGGPRRLADLKGLRFGAVSPEAFGGWHLALHTLQRIGLAPERDFSELRFFGFPQSSIVNAVLSGEIDAGTVRTGVLEAMIAEGQIPDGALVVLNQINVPDFDLKLSTALVPEWLMASTPTAPRELRRSVARVLLETASASGRITKWQTPQSLASVIAIQTALARKADVARPTDWPQYLLYAVIALTLCLLLAIESLRWIRPRTRTPPSRTTEIDPETVEKGPVPSASITAREEQVLKLVETGKTTKEIARLLSISPKTVEFHRHNLMQKFDAANMADLVHRSGLWRQSDALKDQT